MDKELKEFIDNEHAAIAKEEAERKAHEEKMLGGYPSLSDRLAAILDERERQKAIQIEKELKNINKS